MKKFLMDLNDLVGKTITCTRERFVFAAIHFGDEVALFDCEAGFPELCTDEGLSASFRIALGIEEAEQFFDDKDRWPEGVLCEPGEGSLAYIKTSAGRQTVLNGDWIGKSSDGRVVNYGQLKI